MKTEVKYLGNTEGELFTSWHYVYHVVCISLGFPSVPPLPCLPPRFKANNGEPDEFEKAISGRSRIKCKLVSVVPCCLFHHIWISNLVQYHHHIPISIGKIFLGLYHIWISCMFDIKSSQSSARAE